ncbi:MAG: tetratricopeptide repeat protein [Acidobacteria bacterium]|nr:tetratricopeptide repeat protein [Acidobacteriota bacterium]
MRPATSFSCILICFTSFCIADYKQAVSYFQQKNYAKAIQAIKPDLDAHPDWEFGQRLTGISYVKMGEYAQSIPHLTKAVELKSLEFSTYLALAEAYFNLNRYTNASNILLSGERFVKNPNDRYQLYHVRGAAFFKQKRYTEAIQDLTAALRVDPGDADDHSMLGIAYFQVGRLDEAQAALQDALTRKPNHPASQDYAGRVHGKKGALALEAKNYAQAVEEFRKALRYLPNDGATYFNLGVAQIFVGDLEEAERALVEAARLIPDHSQVHKRLGFVYEKRRQYDKSLQAYQRAYQLEKDPALKESIDRITQRLAQSKS